LNAPRVGLAAEGARCRVRHFRPRDGGW
jgi:hypothetical protein